MTKTECFRKGRRCGIPGAGRKKSEKTLLKEKEELARKRAREEERYEAFSKAPEGNFDGYDFVNVFHEKIDKNNAILAAWADDTAKVVAFGKTYRVDEDGKRCFFFSKNPTKRVIFNSSTYFF